MLSHMLFLSIDKVLLMLPNCQHSIFILVYIKQCLNIVLHHSYFTTIYFGSLFKMGSASSYLMLLWLPFTSSVFLLVLSLPRDLSRAWQAGFPKAHYLLLPLFCFLFQGWRVVGNVDRHAAIVVSFWVPQLSQKLTLVGLFVDVFHCITVTSFLHTFQMFFCASYLL